MTLVMASSVDKPKLLHNEAKKEMLKSELRCAEKETVCYAPLADVIQQDFNGNYELFSSELGQIVIEAGKLTHDLSDFAHPVYPTYLEPTLKTRADAWLTKANNFLQKVCNRKPNKVEALTLRTQGERFTYYAKLCSFHWILEALVIELAELEANSV